MSSHRRLIPLGAAIFASVVSVSQAGQDPPDKVLENKGLRKAGSYFYVLAGERELSNALRRRRPTGKIYQVQRKVRDITRRLQAAEGRLQEVDEDKEALFQRLRSINQARATRRGSPPEVQNRLIADYNDVVHQLKVTERERFTRARVLPDLREDIGKARASYLQTLLDVRDLADKTLERYEVLKKDPDVVAALAALNADRKTKREIVLGPSSLFAQALKKLDRLERVIPAELVDLRAQQGVLSLDTIVNGRHRIRMVLDTGAAFVALPADVAKQVGLKPAFTDPTVILQLADGTTVDAKVVRLKSLRVGKFKVDDVKCAVLPRSMSNAPLLLGQSFLRHFTYQIDSEGRKLTLRKLEIPTDEAKTPAKGKTRRRRR